jgi:hypothetical protein
MDARDLTMTLGGTWYGSYGLAPCPVCQPEGRHDQRGLKLSNREDEPGLLLHCFKLGCDFRQVLAAAGIAASVVTPMPSLAWRELERRRDADLEQRSRRARQVWENTRPIQGTPAETYLRGRSITCELPPTLRYHPACWHPSGQALPAMVALVEGGAGFAVHRTYLRTDGSGKAEVEPPKAMLGRVSGGAVRLVQAPAGIAAPLVLAEGLETALSLGSGLLHGAATIWAALSTSGLASLRLPGEPGHLIVAADGDKAGLTAAQALATRAQAEGWTVSLRPAPERCDWNDVLTQKAAKGEAA